MSGEDTVLGLGVLSVLMGFGIAAGQDEFNLLSVVVGGLVFFVFIGAFPTYEMLKSWRHDKVEGVN